MTVTAGESMFKVNVSNTTTSLNHPKSEKVEKMSSLAQMFPLLSSNEIQEVLNQNNENLLASVDQLLVRDLLDSEKDQQDMITNNRPLCKLWVSGECTGGRASACRDRHYLTDDDNRRQPASATGGQAGAQLTEFSSPYKARVVREKVKVFKEQFNLETGKEESVWETQEKEIIDLTGSVSEEMAGIVSESSS